jgi:hypothetical protein
VEWIPYVVTNTVYMLLSSKSLPKPIDFGHITMDALVCQNQADQWNSEQLENILGIQNIFVLNFLKFHSIFILVPTCTSCILSFTENTVLNGLSHFRPDRDKVQLSLHGLSCIITKRVQVI